MAGISPSKVSPLEPGTRQPGIDIGDLIVQTISDIDDVWYERFKAIDRSYSGPRVRLTNGVQSHAALRRLWACHSTVLQVRNL